MALVKVQKNKAYYKRLQTKYRRRREGKTDYGARRKMVKQDKNKYNTPKNRLVVRITGSKVICQIVQASMIGDKVICQALSSELERYGVPVGHTNYPACYATGLLIARRLLNLKGLDEEFVGMEEATAEEYHVEEEENERRPMKVILDVGLIRTIPGSRVFGVLKGAVDGGLYVPHNVKNFPGYKEPEERGMDYEYDAEAHRERIMGVHVQEYMEMLAEEDPEKYKVQFSKYIENDIEADGVEDMYSECHAAIRENPVFEKDVRTVILENKRQGNKIVVSDGNTYTRCQKRSLQQRRDRVQQKMVSAMKKLAQGSDEEEE